MGSATRAERRIYDHIHHAGHGHPPGARGPAPQVNSCWFGRSGGGRPAVLRVRQAWTPGGGLALVDNSQWGRLCVAVILLASFGCVRAVVHASCEWSSSSLSPSNNKNKQALEFCKECPQNVRTWSLHDTGYCMIQVTVPTHTDQQTPESQAASTTGRWGRAGREGPRPRPQRSGPPRRPSKFFTEF